MKKKIDSSFQAAKNELDFERENPLNTGEEEEMKEALKALKEYEEALQEMRDRGIILSPLNNQQLVFSTRMKGAFCTMDGIMLRNAEIRNIGRIGVQAVRPACFRTYLYKCAMDTAHKQVSEGNLLTKAFLNYSSRKILEISSHATNALHDEIFSSGEDFYIKPKLPDTLATSSTTAQDLNNVLGWIAITSMDFFCQDYFIHHPSEPTHNMWELLNQDAYDEKIRIHLEAWRYYFLVIMKHLAVHNMELAKSILELHDAMTPRFVNVLSTKWAEVVMNFVFSSPIFNISGLANWAKISVDAATQLVQLLIEANIVQDVRKSDDSESAVYSFEALMRLIRV
ncbi:MAG: hypothetical protein ACK49N_04610 [Verrucomicrobiota bacterium]